MEVFLVVTVDDLEDALDARRHWMACAAGDVANTLKPRGSVLKLGHGWLHGQKLRDILVVQLTEQACYVGARRKAWPAGIHRSGACHAGQQSRGLPKDP
jgi:hypothetical protein